MTLAALDDDEDMFYASGQRTSNFFRGKELGMLNNNEDMLALLSILWMNEDSVYGVFPLEK